MKLFAEITKIDRERRMVFGYASTEALDSQGEVVRKEAIEAALPDYMRFANTRTRRCVPSATARSWACSMRRFTALGGSRCWSSSLQGR
jgi:hypothetical protein